MKKWSGAIMAMLVVFAWGSLAHSAPKIVGKSVDYNAAGQTMKGYLAFDENVPGKRAGVLVVPEWWGVNDYVQKRARMLAEMGYAALVVDMYGEGKQAQTPDEARKLSSGVTRNPDLAWSRFMAAMDFLKGQANVDPARIAAIGYCFGGGVVLNMARRGADLRGVASFHGDLTPVKPAKAGAVKAKILVLTGGDDSFVPKEKVSAFESEMKAAGADYRVITYPGAKHSFTNPDADSLGKKFNMPIAYNRAVDEQSWDETKRFLERIFK